MQSSSSRYRVVFTVTNCICFDQRVLKMAETVSNLGCDVAIVGRESGECCKSGSVPFRTIRFKMIFKRGFLFYKFINARIFLHLLFNKYDLVVANDLDTLLPGFIISKLKRIALVYDSHEYFTGVPELSHKPLRKWFWKSLDKLILPRIVNFITVSNSIAGLYRDEYGSDPLVVRNVARNTSLIDPCLRSEVDLPENALLLIYQGRGINIERGGEELIESLVDLDNVFLLVIGGGDVFDTLQIKATRLGLNGKVKFISTLPWDELMRYTKCADAGLSLDKDTNINYRFSLPNKVFDYLSAGIPVIAGSLTEVESILREHNCGLVIPKVSPDEVRKAILKLRDDRELLNKLKANAVIASGKLNWDSESIKVSEFYKNILKSI